MLQRREVVLKINQGRGDALMVTGLGSSSYDLHAAAMMTVISISGGQWAVRQ